MGSINAYSCGGTSGPGPLAKKVLPEIFQASSVNSLPIADVYRQALVSFFVCVITLLYFSCP